MSRRALAKGMANADGGGAVNKFLNIFVPPFLCRCQVIDPGMTSQVKKTRCLHNGGAMMVIMWPGKSLGQHR